MVDEMLLPDKRLLVYVVPASAVISHLPSVCTFCFTVLSFVNKL